MTKRERAREREREGDKKSNYTRKLFRDQVRSDQGPMIFTNEESKDEPHEEEIPFDDLLWARTVADREFLGHLVEHGGFGGEGHIAPQLGRRGVRPARER